MLAGHMSNVTTAPAKPVQVTTPVASSSAAKPVAATSPVTHPSTPPAPVATAASPQCHLPPHHPGSGEPGCIVHRLEDALQLVESLHLTADQKTKIGELTKKQTEESHALCTKEKQLHQAAHTSILAILNPEQQKTLSATGSEVCGLNTQNWAAPAPAHLTAQSTHLELPSHQTKH